VICSRGNFRLYVPERNFLYHKNKITQQGEPMRDENRAHEITREIGQLILQDPKLAHDTWNAFSLVFCHDQNKSLSYGFMYDIRGKVTPFSAEVPEHLMSELRECLKEENTYWRACLLQVKAANWEMSWEFEYDHPERFIPTGDVNELASFLAPELDHDQCWHCPLSHRVLEQLKQHQSHLVDDMEEENLHCMITNCLLKGMRYGLKTRSDLASFAMTCFEIAPNFDRHPAIRAAFEKVKGVPGSVWNMICSAVPEHVWDEMRTEKFYDSKAWFNELPQAPAEEVA
jgi:hypothetical protein